MKEFAARKVKEAIANGKNIRRGDVIYYQARYYDDSKKRRYADMAHVEVWWGDDEIADG